MKRPDDVPLSVEQMEQLREHERLENLRFAAMYSGRGYISARNTRRLANKLERKGRCRQN